ncbi:hypothetical protein V5O48_018000 [Marasmius crinis-equi]|uniref:Uncharacterized protein n=1 Tax=Marasmius crinis-equi TaxID=585013 RepID=A0ABR3EME3_9AGAR
MASVSKPLQTDSFFDHIFQLPEALIAPALQVSNYAGHFVGGRKPGSETSSSFRWTEFLQRLSGSNLRMLRFQSDAINQHTTTTKTVVNNIVGLLDLGPDRSEHLTRVLEAVLTAEAKPDKGQLGYVDLDSTGGSWQYRIHIAYLPEEGAPEVFHSLVATIKLQADASDVDEESFWWDDLQKGTSRTLSVVVDVVEFVVREDFRDPLESRLIR